MVLCLDSCQGLSLVWLRESGSVPGAAAPVSGDEESCKQQCLAQFGNQTCYSFNYDSSLGQCAFNTIDKRSANGTIQASNGVNLEWNCENSMLTSTLFISVRVTMVSFTLFHSS